MTETLRTPKADESLRPIWLCADDYGISPSVDRAIRDLLLRGHINATSVMVAAPSFQQSGAASLNALKAGSKSFSVGLHVTLTAPFAPLTKGYGPVRKDAFLSLAETLLRGGVRLLDRRNLENEIEAQLTAFAAAFGHPPDFIDGHQHVHLFPQVREALLAVAKQHAPHAWLRQCGRASSRRGLGDPKALLLDTLSKAFRAEAGQSGFRTNPAFAGTYNFRLADEREFAQRFPGFLKGLPAQSVVMCHPGFVDDELRRLDPVTTLREREYAYLADQTFLATLQAHRVVLAAK